MPGAKFVKEKQKTAAVSAALQQAAHHLALQNSGSRCSTAH